MAESKPIRVEICPHGDMEIVLKERDPNTDFLGAAKYILQVSSTQLCTGSTVFRAMLGPNSRFEEAAMLRENKRQQFVEAVDQKPFQLSLGADDHNPTALAAVLYVLHARTETLPKTLPFDALVAVAVVCDYYDCATALRPWDEMWMEPWREHAEEDGFESWLLVSWVFGVQEIFDTLTKKFAVNGYAKGGGFHVGDGRRRSTVPLHDGIPEKIIKALTEQSNRLRDQVVSTYLELYKAYEDIEKCHCQILSGYDICDYRILGILHIELQAEGLLPVASGGPQGMAPAYIARTVVGRLESISKHLRQIHGLCLTKIDECLARLSSIPDAAEPLPLSSFAKGSIIKKDSRSWEDLLSLDDDMAVDE
ncbi:hypothetical protein FN846DRAFT_965941 [Sphaerosporella brunnea]|uniref:BTB domain-containing protein n=1 Tax=Sphaerosporella brunnea TaxID=1250544 RepID=A0A5J5EMG2_9PEZI|nr:hypothetical protein FN846DRAFT_965941 [Sphaerosporella brunnea]